MDYKKQEIQQYFNDRLKEILEYTYIEDIKNGNFDLHNEIFHDDYYIIGTYKANQWLGDQVFNVIEFIKEYEENCFGEVTTDFTNPEEIVNMYAYIIGEEIVSDYLRTL